jgi:hypothetical protein
MQYPHKRAGRCAFVPLVRGAKIGDKTVIRELAGGALKSPPKLFSLDSKPEPDAARLDRWS